MIVKRSLSLNQLKQSAFLFGPRMTGKTNLLRTLSPDLYIDLLDPEKELEFKQTPRLFWEIISALKPKSLIIVDEIQRVPTLLDYVQKGIEEKGHTFILSGSSARKLKRGGANLLGGRALDLRLHPLTYHEIGANFHIEKALQFGTLPKVVQYLTAHETKAIQPYLRSYYTTYIKEEIQAEAITRNIGAFQRFLNIAAQSNGQVIEFANISRECSVPMSTVKEYYSILEDTLMGEFLWPWDRSERKKARPKFYFFDTGVIRAMQNRLTDPPTPFEKGFLFETWFVREMVRLRDYANKADEFSFWREGQCEIDLLVSRGHGPMLAFEIKSNRDSLNSAAIKTFQKKFPNVQLIVISLLDKTIRQLDSGIKVMPWRVGLEHYLSL